MSAVNPACNECGYDNASYDFDLGDYLCARCRMRQASPRHSDDHPVATQPGPPGMYALSCRAPGCGWHDTIRPQRDTGSTSVAAILTVAIVVALLGLTALAHLHRVCLDRAAGDPVATQHCQDMR